MYSGGKSRAPIGITMYCLPPAMYVIGPPVVPDGSSVSQITLPVALSYARNFLPQPQSTCGVPLTALLPSPRNSSVLVSSGAGRFGIPSGGRFSPLRSGWSFGPSPFGDIQTWVPLFKSNAVIRPYGPFVMGSPSMSGGCPTLEYSIVGE